VIIIITNPAKGVFSGMTRNYKSIGKYLQAKKSFRKKTPFIRLSGMLYIILNSVHKHHILVTGANGQVGKELRDLARFHHEYNFTFLGREDLPIENFELVRNFFEITKPTAVINCAAYTAVDKAETERELAFQINGEAVGILAAVSKDHGARFVHISTDYVFDGNARSPYKESDPTSPVNTYGDSKLSGEKEAIRLNASSVIVRTSWVYSAYGKNFVKTMIKLMQDRKDLNVVSDQLGSPTYAADLAEALLAIAVSGHYIPGIFHFSNEGVISWYEFAKEIATIINADCTIHAIPATDFPTPAKRPAYSVLDKSRICKAYGILLKPWKESLKVCIKRIIAESHP
jgi:dTDP-4-dehydrorhamnose reductase